ncbi:MAG: dockerin type I domain-containing protein [Oscillospiraceae bacterium]|nr:dockerin type I domain-containing protein [Oscillospiraceae bacterium]
MKKYLKTILTSSACMVLALLLAFSSSALLIGDVSGDGEIDAGDARLVLRHVAKLQTLTGDELLAADADGDGEVTAADARLILRHVAKLETLRTAADETTTESGIHIGRDDGKGDGNISGDDLLN